LSSCGSAGIVVLLVLAVGPASPSVRRAEANPHAIAPLVRYAIGLEKDALYHLQGSQPVAKQELGSSSSTLTQALALGPTGSAASDLRQALIKDQNAASLLPTTTNEGTVRLQINSAILRKEAALTALGEPVAGAFVPAQTVKVPPPVPTPPPANKPTGEPKLTKPAIAKLIEQAGDDEAHAAYDWDDGFAGAALGYHEAYDAYQALRQALEGVYADGNLRDVEPLLGYAMLDDVAVLQGKSSKPVDETLREAFILKGRALNALGFPPLEITAIKAVFDPAQLATDYSIEVTKNLMAPFAPLVYTWTLTLKQIDPSGSSPPGYQSTDPNAPNYASAGFDPTCNDARQPGGTAIGGVSGEDYYEWSGLGRLFIWYHGDEGAYADKYGCDHTKMGERGHQGYLDVRVEDGAWACFATIYGTNRAVALAGSEEQIPFAGEPPHCNALP
jgi:hypothetical protein